MKSLFQGPLEAQVLLIHMPKGLAGSFLSLHFPHFLPHMATRSTPHQLLLCSTTTCILVLRMQSSLQVAVMLVGLLRLKMRRVCLGKAVTKAGLLKMMESMVLLPQVIPLSPDLYPSP